MPIIQIYVTDEEYVEYVKDKEEINKSLKLHLKDQINKKEE